MKSFLNIRLWWDVQVLMPKLACTLGSKVKIPSFIFLNISFHNSTKTTRRNLMESQPGQIINFFFAKMLYRILKFSFRFLLPNQLIKVFPWRIATTTSPIPALEPNCKSFPEPSIKKKIRSVTFSHSSTHLQTLFFPTHQIVLSLI